MPFEIIHAVRAKSVIRIVGGVANTHINLSTLSAQSDETVSAAAIAQVSASTNGIYRIYRGNNSAGTLILEISTPFNLVLYEHDITFANSATSNIWVEHTGTAGSLIMQVTKTASYNPALTGM
jgi:hypothetical protein